MFILHVILLDTSVDCYVKVFIVVIFDRLSCVVYGRTQNRVQFSVKAPLLNKFGCGCISLPRCE